MARPQPLSPLLKRALVATALINVVVGVLFLLGPEIGVTLWPSPISPVLTRFIGAIILGNAAGAWMVSRAPSWEEARALFYVALVYGALVLLTVPPQLLTGRTDRSLWIYVVFTAVFIVPLAIVVWRYERGRG
ncbi:MAG: hypothetical protein M3164_00170 [Actinomycetota bacterium]|nr:hypothetical protein [Actinomycetota bacterium]